MADETNAASALDAPPAETSQESTTNGATPPKGYVQIGDLTVPEKFATGEGDARTVNTAALLKSYGELEKKQGAPALVVPADAKAALDGAQNLDRQDARVEAIATELVAAGLTKEQVQAALPRILDKAPEWQPPSPSEQAQLNAAWATRGATEAADRAAIGAWAKKQPKEVLDAWKPLERSETGLAALVATARAATATSSLPSESQVVPDEAATDTKGDMERHAEVLAMMGDKRYLRGTADFDPAFRAKADAAYRAIPTKDRDALAGRVGGNWAES